MCASPSQKFISKSIRPRLSKRGNVVVVVIVAVVVVAILRYLGLCREANLNSQSPYEQQQYQACTHIIILFGLGIILMIVINFSSFLSKNRQNRLKFVYTNFKSCDQSLDKYLLMCLTYFVSC